MNYQTMMQFMFGAMEAANQKTMMERLFDALEPMDGPTMVDALFDHFAALTSEQRSEAIDAMVKASRPKSNVQRTLCGGLFRYQMYMLDFCGNQLPKSKVKPLAVRRPRRPRADGNQLIRG